eukprot:gb/GEZN01003448.1/.p1 GENE.gb/GEZN01003448.1/~~gb/GEZN01003448.1/.p1  ORF type:complete len:606 (+),score=112.43 gb/GEZN01003448.1/:80-1897(+)
MSKKREGKETSSQRKRGDVLHTLSPSMAASHARDRANWLWTRPPEKKQLPFKPPRVNAFVAPLAAAQGRKSINPVFLTILAGTRDQGSPLRALRGQKDILGIIFAHVKAFWEAHVEWEGVFASRVAQVMFPKPTGININMMPIVLGDSNSVPANCRQYLPLLASCPINRNEWEKIGYLTIHESKLSEEKAQRREGLHTETPGILKDPGGKWEVQDNPPMTIAWGCGFFDEIGKCGNFNGGLYMASSISGSCRVWNVGIADPGSVVGELGDLEHMRGVLGPGALLQAGDLVWITDRTPHESLAVPGKAGQYRQFFRLVTSQVSVWYSEHSTPNPSKTIQLPKEVKVLTHNKFNSPTVPSTYSSSSSASSSSSSSSLTTASSTSSSSSSTSSSSSSSPPSSSSSSSSSSSRIASSVSSAVASDSAASLCITTTNITSKAAPTKDNTATTAPTAAGQASSPSQYQPSGAVAASLTTEWKLSPTRLVWPPCELYANGGHQESAVRIQGCYYCSECLSITDTYVETLPGQKTFVYSSCGKSDETGCDCRTRSYQRAEPQTVCQQCGRFFYRSKPDSAETVCYLCDPDTVFRESGSFFLRWSACLHPRRSL